MLKKLLNDSNTLELLVKAVIGAIAFIVSVTVFFGDLRGLPPRVSSLESRVAALELNYATGMSRIETILTSMQNDLAIFKVQVTKLGMEKSLDKTYKE